jgi:hypothetical protein
MYDKTKQKKTTTTTTTKCSYVVFSCTHLFTTKGESDADDNAIMGQMWRIGLRV